LSVRLEILSSDDTLVGKANLEGGDRLRFVADSEARIGHIKPGAELLARAIGIPVEYVIAERKPEPAPIIKDREAAKEAVGKALDSYAAGNRTRDLPKKR